MNALELADGILAIEERIFLTKKEHQLFQNSATMLRQQQAEIERLIMLCDCMTTESNRKGNEIEELEKENTDLRYLIATKLEQQAEIEMLEAELKAMREQLNANQV